MKRLKVITARVVKEQIRAQALYIALDSIENALAWEDRLCKVMLGIGDLPGHAIDEDASSRLGETVRKTVFESTYLIHYRLTRNPPVVEVINFRHGMRLPRRGEP